MPMTWAVAGPAVLLAGWLGWAQLRDRAQRKQRNVFGPWPIPTVPLAELDPVFAPGPYGPTTSTEVSFIGRGPLAVPGGTSDAEAWVLAVLARRARHCFEFGTCTGKTAYLWARNAAPEARVVTLTLPPHGVPAARVEAGDAASDVANAAAESAFEEFLYTGTDVADRITQLFGDSKAFDESPWLDWADLVFVDGSHAESYVRSDSHKAMRIVRPGGLVIWHDYRGPRDVPGVYRALNALAREVPLRHVQGTSFVVWRRPAGGAALA